jgi:hypothetical protein
LTTNNNYPAWLKPLWRRWAIVAFCASWAAFELYNGEHMWAALVGVMAVYGAWMYIWDWKDPDTPPGPAKEE